MKTPIASEWIRENIDGGSVPFRTKAGRLCRRSGCMHFLLAIIVIHCMVNHATAVDVVIDTLDGTAISGALETITPTAIGLASGDTPRRTVDRHQIWRLSTKDDPTPDASSSSILLTNGDRIVGDVESIKDDLLTTTPNAASLPSIAVPLEFVRSVVFAPPRQSSARLLLERTLFDWSHDFDAVLLENGDRTIGELVGLTDRKIKFTVSGTSIEILAERVTALAMNADLVSQPKVGASTIVVSTSNGSSLSCRSIALTDEKAVQMQLVVGPDLRLPMTLIRDIYFYGGQAIDLASIRPTNYVHNGFLGGTQPFQINRNVRGAVLRLRDRQFSRGLGVTSHSELEYQLDPRASHFVTTAGIDDIARGSGSVVMSVDLDGRRAFTSPILTGESPPLVIGPIEIGDAESMLLRVEYADRGDINDVACWCNPTLILKPASSAMTPN